MEHNDKLSYGYVATPQACAKYCVDEGSFTCNSYDFCGGTNAPGNCRLNKNFISNSSVLSKTTTCDHYDSMYNVFK